MTEPHANLKCVLYLVIACELVALLQQWTTHQSSGCSSSETSASSSTSTMAGGHTSQRLMRCSRSTRTAGRCGCSWT